jgi:hypothetical protein
LLRRYSRMPALVLALATAVFLFAVASNATSVREAAYRQ